ncbi:MAG: phage BR0599 family protein [Deltaproteobacteria bacterium]|nr:phage BR0599 family protein [Deltaproteobacteria bacterium]
MSQYDVIDRSPDASAPAELFQFSGGAEAYYASGQRTVSWNGYDYLADWILHSDLEQSDELNKQELEITLRASSPVAQAYVEDIPAVSVNVRVYRYLEGLAEFRLVWAGRVTKPVFGSDNDECVLTCEPIFTMLRRAGLRRNYQIICPYSLYDGRCRVIRAEHTRRLMASAVQGGRIQFQGAPTAGYHTGGVLRYGARYRLIIDDSGGWIQLAGSVPGLKAGDFADLSAGCDKSLATCAGKFSNNLNFGGFPYIPLKNPFTGDSLGS